MEPLCLAVAALSALFALLLTPVARHVARRAGFIDRPGGRKIHREPTPYGGGVALAAAMLLALAAGAFLYRKLLYDPAWNGWYFKLGLDQYVREVRMSHREPLSPLLWKILAGAGGALIFGLADDRWAFRPLTKLAVQFVLAAAVVAGGVRITALVGDNLAMQALTVLWIVFVTNSFNLLDNMDGLCAGTVSLTSGVLALVALAAGQPPLALALAALCGASLGFLRYNLAPATIFLGDAGSMFVGFLMACLTVATTYYQYRESALSVGVPLMILAVPLYDTATVFWIRLREGRGLLTGDTSHFSHRLVDLGMSRRQAVATIHLAALAIALPAAVLRRLSDAEGIFLIAQAVLILTLIALLERAGAQRARGRREDGGEGGGDA